MIIFLYGADTYRSRQKLNEIIDHYKEIHKSGLNLRFFNEEKLNLQDFKDALDSVSMFREKKLLILEGVFSSPQFKEELLKQKERLVKVDDIILIYEKKDISKNDRLFKFLEKNSKVQEFKLLEGEKLKSWVKKEFLKYKTPHQNPEGPSTQRVECSAYGAGKFGAGQAEIEPAALELLINYVGNNLWQMENEIKKIASYAKGKKVKMRDIELLVRPKIELDIFKTIDALSEKKKSLALNLIHKHLERGDDLLYLLSMIKFQFRNLLMIKSYEPERGFNANYINMRMLAEKLEIHPYVVRKSLKLSKKFTCPELKKIYQKIFQADLDIKTGRISPEIALDLLIAEI